MYLCNQASHWSPSVWAQRQLTISVQKATSGYATSNSVTKSGEDTATESQNESNQSAKSVSTSVEPEPRDFSSPLVRQKNYMHTSQSLCFYYLVANFQEDCDGTCANAGFDYCHSNPPNGFVGACKIQNRHITFTFLGTGYTKRKIT